MIARWDAPALPVDARSLSEIRRYALLRDDRQADERIRRVLPQALKHVRGQVCYTVCPVSCREETVSLGFTAVSSRSLCSLLSPASQCLVFASTIGLDFDRLIRRTAQVSTTDAFLLHAIGTERIEAVCDAFQASLRDQGMRLTRRFSPGYGDVPLNLQRDLFRFLDCPRQIGLTLNDSLIMSPSKSVTAILGILPLGSAEGDPARACANCGAADCIYRISPCL